MASKLFKDNQVEVSTTRHRAALMTVEPKFSFLHATLRYGHVNLLNPYEKVHLCGYDEESSSITIHTHLMSKCGDNRPETQTARPNLMLQRQAFDVVSRLIEFVFMWNHDVYTSGGFRLKNAVFRNQENGQKS